MYICPRTAISATFAKTVCVICMLLIAEQQLFLITQMTLVFFNAHLCQLMRSGNPALLILHINFYFLLCLSVFYSKTLNCFCFDIFTHY